LKVFPNPTLHQIAFTEVVIKQIPKLGSGSEESNGKKI